VGQNGGVAFGGGHRRWVGTDGTPVVWRPAPGASAAAPVPAAPIAAAPTGETAGQEDARTPVMVAEDGVPTPPTGIPTVAADRPHHRPRWWSDALHDPERHRPLPRWESPDQPTPPPADPAPAADSPPAEAPQQRVPRKLTVTRVAALRSREITENGIRAFHRAATADGAGRSGLTALTYTTMGSYALDAAVAVALANTLFFAAATAESKTNVALYLAITVAPFAVVAPVIGPLLDRLQRGRRAALAVSFGGRAVLAVVMAYGYHSWVLYPAALGTIVLSKSFVVLKAAVTPRVLPEALSLVTTNSRLTTFGLAAGTVFGGIAAGIAALWGSPGALFYTAALGVAGAVLCLLIPAWVEVTDGEVPAAIRYPAGDPADALRDRVPAGHAVVVALWGNSAIRVLTGFLTLFVAFVVKAQSETEPARQLALIGLVGAAAGIGSFVGNALGARQRFDHSDALVLAAVAVSATAAGAAGFLPGIGMAAVVALLGATCSALAKVALDAVIQRDLPERSRASAFGRSETVLQLAWVFGGALGVLLPHDTYRLGFGVVTGVMAVVGVQAALVARGHTLLPPLRLPAHRPRRRSPAPDPASPPA
jgi:MFS family permease